MRSCTAGSLVNRNCCDEENYGRSRRYERHLTSVRSDNTSRHTLNAGGWIDWAAMVAEGSARESLLRLSLSTRDLGSRIGVVLVSRTLNLSLRDVGGEHKPWRADHARFCDRKGLNVCTVESLVHGDHRNENTWLGTAFGGCCSVIVSPCTFDIDSVSSRARLVMWLGFFFSFFLFQRLAELCGSSPEHTACPQANCSECTMQQLTANAQCNAP